MCNTVNYYYSCVWQWNVKMEIVTEEIHICGTYFYKFFLPDLSSSLIIMAGILGGFCGNIFFAWDSFENLKFTM